MTVYYLNENISYDSTQAVVSLDMINTNREYAIVALLLTHLEQINETKILAVFAMGSFWGYAITTEINDECSITISLPATVENVTYSILLDHEDCSKNQVYQTDSVRELNEATGELVEMILGA